MAIETLEKRHTVVYWAGFYYEMDGRKNFAKDNIFKIQLKKQTPIVFTKIFYIRHFPYGLNHNRLRSRTHKVFKTAFNADFADIINAHIHAWQVLWKRADIAIKGTANLQQNLRFNIYHMLISAHIDNGFSGIGARTLSGEGYRGHIFWDGEIFLLPFYLFTFPEVARNMLLYRYKRLDASRELAKREGYKGAKFAWESASTGEEETPEWARDIDGTIIKIYTQKMEHYITACVAYAFYRYYLVTKDEKFMEDYGYEVLFETARFWASSVKWHSKTKKYDILNIIGPDEFHIDVNNNAFTNLITRWNLLTAHTLFNKVKKRSRLHKKMRQKLLLSNKEAAEWRNIAFSITVNIDKNSIIEEFDGYFKFKKMILTQTDENGMPVGQATCNAHTVFLMWPSAWI